MLQKKVLKNLALGGGLDPRLAAIREEGIGIHVGGEDDIESIAPLRLASVDEVGIFLDWLLRVIAKREKAVHNVDILVKKSSITVSACLRT